MITEDTLSEWSKITDEIIASIGRMYPTKTVRSITRLSSDFVLVNFFGNKNSGTTMLNYKLIL
jgi:hypothetical protein